MRQSEQVLEWKTEERAESLVDVLELKFGPVPADLASAIRATTDFGKLRQWLASAVSALSLDAFRADTQL